MLSPQFCCNFQVTAIETAATPLTEKHYKWTSINNSVFFAGAAFVGMLGMLSGMYCEKRFGGQFSLTTGLFFMASGFTLWIIFDGGSDLPMAPYIAGSVLAIYGLCFLTPSNSSYYTKIIEYQGGAQGLCGGIFSVFMSAGKSVGPLASGYALKQMDKTGVGPWIIFVICCPVLIINIVGLGIVRRTLQRLDSAVKQLQVNREAAQGKAQNERDQAEI